MMKGKFLDMMKDYNGAQEQFAKAHNQMIEDKKNGKHVRNFDEGNLLFRYGWALIRSEKDLDKGIEILKDADLKMTNNFDLKVKLAQILFQEKMDFKEGLKYVTQALELKKDEPEALVLYGKMLIKEREPKLAAEALEKVITQCDPSELTESTSNVIKN